MFRILCLITLSLLSCCCQKKELKNVAHFNLFTEPPCLDPRRAIDITSSNILIQLFDGLTRFDQDDKPQLADAKSIEISNDGLVYTIVLKENYWSNGDKLTSDDYVETWKEILDPLYPSSFAYKLFIIKNAKAIKAGELPISALGLKTLDERQFQITLEHPTPFFLELLCFPTFFPTNRNLDEHWESEGGSSYVSNGPYQLSRWVHDGEIILTPNPHYREREKVKLDRIELCMIEDDITEFYMFEQKEIDWCGSPFSNIPPEVAPTLIKEKRLNTYNTTATYFLQINTNRYPLHNTKIRRALALAINRSALIDHVFQIDHTVAQSLTPNLPGFEKHCVAYKDASLLEAKQLFDQGLEQEGLNIKDFPVLTLSYNTSKQHQKIMQAIQEQWHKILGIKVNLEVADWKAFLSQIAKQNYDICRSGWMGEYFDPISYLNLFKTTKSDGINHTGWHNDTYARLLDEAEQEMNSVKRKCALASAEKILMDQMPIIPICHQNFAYLANPRLKGVYTSPLGIIDLKEARFE